MSPSPGSDPARGKQGRRRAVPARVQWAVDVLDPRPNERILEIGCGPGVAAALVCARLTSGTLVATDRSPVAIERAVQRNATYVEDGRLRVEQVALADLAEPPGTFDQAFAINVNLFWVGAATAELEVLREVLRPGARLSLFYESSGPTPATRVVGAVSSRLGDHGFTDVALVTGEAGFCVTALAPGGRARLRAR